MTDPCDNGPVEPQKALQAPIRGEGAPTPRKRMDMLTRATVLRLREGDEPMSFEQIASTLGISESSARRICQANAADHKAGIQRVMRTADLEMLNLWFKAGRVQAGKGYFQAMQAWLEADGSIDAKAGISANVNIAPTVNLVMPFRIGGVPDPTPTPAPTTIEAEKV